MIDTGLAKVTVERVDDLYAEYERMDRPGYYEDGQVNPYLGRVSVIPRKATCYAMVPADQAETLILARQLLKGVARRRKVREKVCTKAEINFNQFAKAGEIVVLYA